ncbi:MAG: trypsin-like peptidase domain-containing protein [Planctomycetes bacterium]|nr:trypsin-like peptidase domain-containing protein [Planctomycetota bacterium]
MQRWIMSDRWSVLVALAVFGAGATVLAADRAAARPAGVLPEVATQGVAPAAEKAFQAALVEWLDTERPADVLGRPIQARISQEELLAIEQPEPVNGAPLKVGTVVSLGADRIDISGVAPLEAAAAGRAIAGGTFSPTADGGFVWAASVGSEYAGGVRLHIENLSLPANAELYFYNGSGEAYGPYTGAGPEGTGEFWTPSVLGRQGVLQMRFQAPVTDEDLADVSLTVNEVGHISRSFFGFGNEQVGTCGINADCVVNTNCANDPIVANAELAVAKMLWISGAFIYTCTGGLLADTVPSSQIPYFLTANHCLSKSNSNLEAFFQYQAACGSTANCTGTWDDPPPGSYAGKTVGATVKASNRKGDFTLLQLNQNPPAGSYFLGWTSTAVANSNGTLLYRVSHPSGAPQSYSRHSVSTSAPTCTGWPRGERIYSRDQEGATEGGSSGSPVINAAGQVVGQLSGACGTNLNDVCDSVRNATVDGAFAYYWSKVQPYLSP